MGDKSLDVVAKWINRGSVPTSCIVASIAVLTVMILGVSLPLERFAVTNHSTVAALRSTLAGYVEDQTPEGASTVAGRAASAPSTPSVHLCRGEPHGCPSGLLLSNSNAMHLHWRGLTNLLNHMSRKESEEAASPSEGPVSARRLAYFVCFSLRDMIYFAFALGLGMWFENESWPPERPSFSFNATHRCKTMGPLPGECFLIGLLIAGYFFLRGLGLLGEVLVALIASLMPWCSAGIRDWSAGVLLFAPLGIALFFYVRYRPIGVTVRRWAARRDSRATAIQNAERLYG